MTLEKPEPTEYETTETGLEEAVTILQELARAGSPDLGGSPGQSGTGRAPPPAAETTTGDAVQDAAERWSEQTFRGVLEALPDALVIADQQGRIGLVNSQTERLFGYVRGELIQQAVEILIPERFRQSHVKHREQYSVDPHVRPMATGLDLFGRRKDGSEFPVEVSLSPLHTETGLYVISTIRDISDKIRLQARYRTLVEEIPAVTFMASLEGGVDELYVSPQIEELLGFSQKEWIENPVLWYTQLHEDDRERWHDEFSRTVNRAEHFQSVYRFRARDGRVVWVHGEAKVGRDTDGRPLFLQGVAFDITDRKEAEETLRHARDELEVKVEERTAQIRASLEEKEVLLKEIHHRVKNNLQLISSMLRLQSANIDNSETLEVFRVSQDRVKAMARIHEELYRADDLARIDFGQYTQRLASSLVRSFGSGIELTVEIQDVYFGIDTAIPCGLIVNELVSNCLKYAFSDRNQGSIRISMATHGNREATLIVSDDGIGFPEGVDFRRTDSLGLKLVNALVQQLRGTIELRRDVGTQFEIHFLGE